MSNAVIDGDLIETNKSRIVQTSNPMILMDLAISKGTDIAQLDALMNLYYKWEDRNAKKSFDGAMAELQSQVPVIAKNGKAGFNSNDGKYFISYSYAKLEDIAIAINPLLSKTGLSFRWDQSQDDSEITITCIVSHKDGHSESVPMTAPRDTTGKKNYIQSIGSTISYLRRYTILGAFGLTVSDDDSDGGDGGDGGDKSDDFKKMMARGCEAIASGKQTVGNVISYMQKRFPEITQDSIEVLKSIKVRK